MTQENMLTLKPLYTNALRKYRDRTVLHFDGHTMTYGEVFRQGCRAAHALIAAGVEANTRVALLMSNCPEYLVADQAIIQSGGAKVPLNDMLGEKEIRYILADSQTRVAFVGANFLDIVVRNRQHWPELETVVALLPPSQCPDGVTSWEAFLERGEETVPEVTVNPDDLALIAYTGGTTGLPKGAEHSQQGTVIDMFAHIMELGLLDDERIVISSPLPHSAGFVLLAAMLKGATFFIERGFDPERVVRRISEDRATFMFMVPTMIYRVIDWIGDREYDLSALRTIMYGAAPITIERLRQGLALFGPVFMQIYGQTEAPNLVTRLTREDHRLDDEVVHRLKSCGQPAALAQVRVVDRSDRDVPTGESGELVVRTPYNLLCYHDQPEKSAETLAGGWLHTGDIARLDEDGYVYLLDRSKDMIISGGMNVYTREVEDAVQTCPGVSQVAVVGLPHADWGEMVTAFVVPRGGADLAAEQVIEHCRTELSKYKRPKRVHFLPALPLTPYGKPDKKALRQQAEAGSGAS